MSKLHPVILFVGNRERGIAFDQVVQSHGWYVVAAQDMMEALGNYIHFMPDVVVIDTQYDVEVADPVYDHLRSIDAQGFIFLADEHELWNVAVEEGANFLPSNATYQEIADCIANLTGLNLATT